MKLVIIIMTTLLLQVSAATVAQRITYVKQGTTLDQVFREIKKQTGFKVLYSNQVVDGSLKIDADFKNLDLKVVMETLLKNQALSYEIADKLIMIKGKESSLLDNIVAVFKTIDVRGRIVDAEGRPLPGASVRIKDKGKTVSAGAKGEFYLENVEDGVVLVISFIGYVPKELIAVKDLGDVVLELSDSKLDEVQVIAYGTTTQRLSTGNVTTIKADVIEKQPVNNPLLALQGRVPGLFIEQATGFAGTGVKVRIQGQNSMANGNDPLYIIDGVPYPSQLPPGGNVVSGNSGNIGTYGNPLNFINPSDIESIDVLKDADATSIYGSRAANGAIIITTKKGKIGDTKISLNLQSGWGQVTQRLDLMNSVEYLEMRREALKNDEIEALDLSPYGDNDLNGNWDNSRYTDWQKELIGNKASYHDFNASFSGGNERITYLVGTNYHRETSVFPGNFSDQKGSTHLNISNMSANNRFKMQFSGSYLFNDNKMPNADLTEKAVTLPPVAPQLYLPDGSINWGTDESGASTFFNNPLAYLYTQFFGKTSNLVSNLNLSYELFRGLDLKTGFGYTSLNSNTNNKFYLESSPPEFRQYGTRSTIFGSSGSNSWIIEPQLNYKRQIQKGVFEMLLGATLLQTSMKSTEISASGFSSDLVMDDILSAPVVIPTSNAHLKYRYNAIFGRVNYNWQDRYIVNLSGRRDGSSRFGPKNQFHNFASIGGAWIFSNERPIKEILNFLSFGKLRGSYGITGSDQIGDYQYLSLYNPTPQEVPFQGVVIYEPTKLTNPYLEWEETKKLQFGIDLGFIRDKIVVNANFYTNHSSNQLNSYRLPLTTGFSSIIRNQPYKIRNSGWEIMASTSNIDSRNFHWKTSLNITVPHTLLVDYPEIIKSSNAAFAIIGKPLSAQYFYHFLGVDASTGHYLFADKNGNPTNTPNPQTDKTVIIDLAPKLYGGFQNTMTYKGFQLDFSFSFVKQKARNYAFGSNSVSPGSFLGGNQLAKLLNRWQKPGDVAPYQRYATGFNLFSSISDVNQSDAGISDASYLRLRNVSLSWTAPSVFSKRIYLQSCTLFMQGQNLWTWTNYPGLDPETKSATSLPILRIFTMGIKIGI